MSGVKLLLSEREFVAFGLGQNDDQRAAPLWRVTMGILPDAPSPEAA